MAFGSFSQDLEWAVLGIKERLRASLVVGSMSQGRKPYLAKGSYIEGYFPSFPKDFAPLSIDQYGNQSEARNILQTKVPWSFLADQMESEAFKRRQTEFIHLQYKVNHTN